MLRCSINKHLKNRIKKEMPKNFPINLIRELNFGSADGHRDGIVIEDAFIETSAVKIFCQNRHSIISGVIGSGKSTIFQLLKKKSEHLPGFENSLIVPIEEAISFKQLREVVSTHFPSADEQRVFQLIWLFQIAINISEQLDKDIDLEEMDRDGLIIKDFLRDTNSSQHYDTVIDKFKNLISSVKVKIQAKFKDGPVSISSEINNEKSKRSKLINLDKVIDACNKIIIRSNYEQVLIIIDKIDRFVSGEEYSTQKLYVQSLLELEDDLHNLDAIKFKIFLRKDLFERIDFTALGFDKVNDNTIELIWSKDEIISFISRRLRVALKTAGIINVRHIVMSTNLDEYHLSGIEILRLNPNISWWAKSLLTFGKELNHERKLGLYSKLDRSIITKIFPRNITHCSEDGIFEEISIFHFLESHFRDGHGSCTPRYLLIFLKETQREVAAYYDDNPDQEAPLIDIDGNLEWEVFKKGCVYDAYRNAKMLYTKNIEEADNNWTKNFQVFQSKKGKKTSFDYKWVRANVTGVSEEEALQFLAFLQVIGYLLVKENNSDIRKRKYALPILYRSDQACSD